MIKGSLFSIFSFFNQGVSFVLLIVLAKYILPEDYGNLSLFNTIITFLSFVICLSTNGYVSVSYFKKNEEFTRDFSIVIIITFFVSTLLFLLLIFSGSYITEILHVSLHLLYLAVLISVFSCLYQLQLDIFRIKENLKLYGLLSCSYAIINFILALLLVVSFSLGWEGRVYSQLLTCFFYSFIAICYWRRFKFFNFSNISKECIKRIVFWGLPLIPHLATAWIKQGGDRYIINYFYSLEEVGIFSFALNLSNIIYMLGAAFNQTNSVSIYKILSSSEPNKRIILNQQSKSILKIYIIGTIVIVLGSLLLVPIVLPNYKSSLSYFTIIAISGFLQCIYYLYTNYLFYYDKTKNLMYITFGCSVLHLILSLLLTKYSLYYTCAIYVVLQLTMVILVIYQSKKCLKEYLGN